MGKILRFKQVQEETGLSRSTICRRVRQGKFPAPIDLGNNLLGFYAEEIAAWIEDRRRVIPRHGAAKNEEQTGAA